MFGIPSARSGPGGAGVPMGVILLWYGAIVDIPAGWTLCDGTAGAPDMRNFEIVGAGGAYAVGATGGALTHTHTVNQNPHGHIVNTGDVIAAGSGLDDTTNNVDPVITCTNNNHQDPYKAYAFIMKL